MITTKRLIINKVSQDSDGQITRLLADPTIQRAAHLLFTSQQPSRFEVDFLLQSGDFYKIYSREQTTKVLGLLFAQETVWLGQPATELGYLLAPASRGRGIMTEAVAGLVEQLPQPVLAATDQDNLPSQGVLKRAGFHLVSQKPDQLLWQKSGLQ